ncbi:MAG: hypothetical protein PHW03_05855 [Eubacteriales bacterium]|nr:hypothetical protein [Eubacteriales bacterium]MDD4390311.1 hypothetical protein [Eubacteriales bacterium]
MKNLITKAAKVGGLEVTEDELKLINRYAIKELTAEEVFTFKIAICDNEIDRDYEVFPKATLEKMAELYVGKTIISNHQNRAENQCARIYATEVIDGQGETKNGESYTRLVAHSYMVRTESNKDLITEISAGIKKEVSVGCAIGQVVCSICGANQRETLCKHWPAKEYDGKVCYFKLLEPKDAYEVSFVAVPAQPNAGVTKSYGGEEPKEGDAEKVKYIADSNEMKLKLVESFLFVENRKE